LQGNAEDAAVAAAWLGLEIVYFYHTLSLSPKTTPNPIKHRFNNKLSWTERRYRFEAQIEDDWGWAKASGF
jgi:hypothetical protein